MAGSGTNDALDDEPVGDVTLPRESLDPFRRLSLFNSPYPAHDRGCAVDLYPDSNDGISPVAGEVLATRTVRTPEKPYAATHDHLILVACDEEWCAAALGRDVDRDVGLVARVLHVDPAVEAGDRVAVGDSLGEMVRSGFFAPWVDNHVHLGFRTPDRNLHRASGSLPVSLPSAPTPLAWDGTGTVVESGETYVVLDAPTHPGRGAGWCGVGVDGYDEGVEGDGRDGGGGDGDKQRNGDRVGDGNGDEDRETGVLDGGFPHYPGGGLLGTLGGAGSVAGAASTAATTDHSAGGAGIAPVSLLGRIVGDRRGRAVTWREVGVEANGRPAVGLSLFLAREGPAGAKVVYPDHEFEHGEDVAISVVTA
jgi:hypothetical protein